MSSTLFVYALYHTHTHTQTHTHTCTDIPVCENGSRTVLTNIGYFSFPTGVTYTTGFALVCFQQYVLPLCASAVTEELGNLICGDRGQGCK